MNHDLLAAVLASPADDAPRLVLADSLLEQGDPRGEFIIAQCKLAGRLLRRDRSRLEARAAELLAEHQEEWLAPIGLGDSYVTWARGFVESVSLVWSKFLETWPRLREHCPLRHVRIYGLQDGDLDALCRFAWPESITSFSLHATSPGVQGITRFASSPVFRHLTHLNLGLCRLGDDGIAALAASPHLEHLTDLDLLGNDLTAPAMRALARGNLRRLSWLRLHQNKLDDAAMQELAAGNLPLQLLDVWRNEIAGDGVTALTAMSSWSDLHTLNLGSNPIGPAGAQALVDAPTPGNLRSLALGWCDLGAEGAQILSRATGLQLSHLDLRGDKLQNEGVQAIAETALVGTLESLWLANNGIDAVGAQAVAGSAWLVNLRHLSLSNNPIGPEGAAAIGQMAGLRILALDGTGLGEAGCVALASSPALASLVQLQLDYNAIGNRGARALAASPYLADLGYLGIGNRNHLNNHGQKYLRDHYGGRVRM